MTTSSAATWNLFIANVEIVLLMPLYLVILISIFRNRKKEPVFQSHYYTLVISQGLADFATILIFAPVSFSRSYGFGNSLIYHTPGAARFLVTGAPYLLITRGIGVTLITVQRFLTLCRSHSWLENKIKGLHSGLIGLFYWSLSLFVYSPGIIYSEGSYFEDQQSLFIISSETFTKISPLCVVISFFFCATISISLYAIIIHFLCSAKQISSGNIMSKKSRSTEYRLCLHVFLLTFVGILIFFYWLAELLFGSETDRHMLRAIRECYPLISGNYTFINPIVLLILNRDIQRVLNKAVIRKQPIINTLSASGGL